MSMSGSREEESIWVTECFDLIKSMNVGFTKNLFLNNAYKIVLPVTRIGKLSPSGPDLY